MNKASFSSNAHWICISYVVAMSLACLLHKSYFFLPGQTCLLLIMKTVLCCSTLVVACISRQPIS